MLHCILIPSTVVKDKAVCPNSCVGPVKEKRTLRLSQLFALTKAKDVTVAHTDETFGPEEQQGRIMNALGDLGIPCTCSLTHLLACHHSHTQGPQMLHQTHKDVHFCCSRTPSWLKSGSKTGVGNVGGCRWRTSLCSTGRKKCWTRWWRLQSWTYMHKLACPPYIFFYRGLEA
eukprot:scaffold292476_cov18-Tisochrysis_lutea.AAC.3